MLSSMALDLALLRQENERAGRMDWGRAIFFAGMCRRATELGWTQLRVRESLRGGRRVYSMAKTA
jgi:hypothetical protein